MHARMWRLRLVSSSIDLHFYLPRQSLWLNLELMDLTCLASEFAPKHPHSSRSDDWEWRPATLTVCVLRIQILVLRQVFYPLNHLPGLIILVCSPQALCELFKTMSCNGDVQFLDDEVPSRTMDLGCSHHI